MFSLRPMSGLPFELLLALRYLRPKRTFVSVITLISVAGVALGVAVLIVVISVMSGFDKQLRDTILGFNSHIEIHVLNDAMPNYREAMATVRSNKNVRGVAPTVASQVLMETTTNSHMTKIYQAAPYLRGIDPAAETNVSTLASSIIDGNFDVSGHGILIETSLPANMESKSAHTINILTYSDVTKMIDSYKKKEKETAIPPMEYQVRGIFDVGFYDFNASTVVVSLENAQDMSNLGDSVQGLMVMLHDPFRAGIVRNELKESLGPRFREKTWMENKLLGAVAVEKNVMFIILFCVMIVAALCILERIAG